MLGRRDFLKLTLMAAAVPVFEHTLFSRLATADVSSAKLLSSHSDLDVNKYQIPKNYSAEVIAGFVRTLDLNSGKVTSFAVPLYAHVYEQCPAAPELIAGSGKWTNLAIAFDLKAGKVVSQIKAPEGVRFFGHCSFSADGKWLYLTADSEIQKQGFICVVDTADWKIAKLVPSGGRFPHECLLTSSGELCVVNSFATREESSIVFMDTEIFVPLKSIKSPVVAHIAKMDESSYVASGYMGGRKMEIVKINRNTGIVQNFIGSPDYPKESLTGEGLSLVAIDSRYAAITLPNKNALLIWDTEKNRFNLVGQGTGFMGVIKHQDALYLNAGEKGILYKLAAKKLHEGKLPEKLAPEKVTFANGRHLRLIQI